MYLEDFLNAHICRDVCRHVLMSWKGMHAVN